MRFETLEKITNKIYKAIKLVNDNNSKDWDAIDNFCGALQADIVHASDTLSTLPDSMNPEQPYIGKVLMVLRCYSTILESGCFVRVESETFATLKNLVETNYYTVDPVLGSR